MTSTFFLHGLDSSGNGAKGQYFAAHFPHIVRPDFSGDLSARLAQLTALCRDRDDLVFIGSSFGGLMATCHAIANPERVKQLILLAPALNFGEFSPPQTKLATQTLVIIGKNDTVTPADPVIPLAKLTFANPEIRLVDDDHMLHHTFYNLDWRKLLFP